MSHGKTTTVIAVRLPDKVLAEVKEFAAASGLGGVSPYLAWLIEMAQDERVLDIILRLQAAEPR